MANPRLGPIDIDVAYEHGLTLRQHEGSPLNSPIGAPIATTWLDLQWTITDQEHVRWTHRFDRLVVSGSGNRWDAAVGRQAISWATTLFLTPADPFAPFDPSDPFREYRAGVDAARLRYYPGALSEVDLVVRPSDTRDGTTLTALARGLTSVGSADVSAWAGMIHDEFGAALGASNTVGAFEIRTEASLRRGTDGDMTLRLAAGADGRFTVAARDLYLVLEYQHDGFGAGGAEDLVSVALSPAFSRAELQVLGRDEVAVSASYQVHPLWMADLLTLVNLGDGSLLVAPGASYSVGAEVSVRGGVFVGVGDGTVDVEQGILGSEYGIMPASAYLSLTWFF